MKWPRQQQRRPSCNEIAKTLRIFYASRFAVSTLCTQKPIEFPGYNDGVAKAICAPFRLWDFVINLCLILGWLCASNAFERFYEVSEKVICKVVRNKISPVQFLVLLQNLLFGRLRAVIPMA